LPEDVGARAEPPPRRGSLSPASKIVGASLAASLAATVLPWTRFGTGSGVFGAWSASAPWSLVAAIAASTGLAWWLLRAIRGRGVEGRAAWGFAGLGALATAGATLAFLAPPSFTKSSLAALIVVVFGVIATLTAVRAGRIRSGVGI
jgi:hypothetical protein